MSRGLWHRVAQVLFLIGAAINIFLTGTVVFRVGWLGLAFLLAAIAFLLGLWIGQARYLIAGVLLDVLGPTLAYLVHAPIDAGQPLLTLLGEGAVLALWWRTRPRYVRHFIDPDASA